MRLSTTFAGFLWLASTSYGQPPNTPIFRTSNQFVPVKGLPYSGIEEVVGTLPPGTSETQRQTHKLFRDGQGRERIERSNLIEIVDPISGWQFTLDPEKKTGHRIRLSLAPPNAIRSLLDTSPPASGVKIVTESLGTSVIQGIEVQGTRVTLTGPPQADARPFNSTFEVWKSNELGLAVFMKASNSRLASVETRIRDVSRGEPSPDLFHPPAEYTIDDAGPGIGPGRGSSTIARPPGVESTPGAPQNAPRVGAAIMRGGVSAPTLISKIEPEYTQEAVAARIQGSVTLAFLVGTDGVPRDIKIVKSLEPGLDQKAIEAVSKWRFRPGQKDGKPVAVGATAEVNFDRR